MIRLSLCAAQAVWFFHEVAMAVVCERLQYLFFVNPLTGSQAITRTLMEHLHGELLPPEDVVRRGKVLARRQNTTPKMVLAAELLSESEFKALLKFTGSVIPLTCWSRATSSKGEAAPAKHPMRQATVRLQASVFPLG
ncbi:hypothetical protein [Ideonella paludis]|uniref:hypothetical protein n=1 Tax=Ideonella paludis TaxID=1233411 RepID=UPI00362FE56C